MRKNLIVNFLAVTLLSIFLIALREICLNLLGATSLPVTAVAGFIILSAASAWIVSKLSSKCKPVYIFFILLLAVSIPDLLYRLPGFSSTLVTLPTLMLWWFGIVAGFIFGILKTSFTRICLAVLCLVIVSWAAGPGYRKFVGDLNSGKFLTQEKEYLITSVVFEDRDNNNVKLSGLRGKHLILYFWDTDNIPTGEELAELNNIYDGVKGSESLSLFSVHCYDTGKTENYKTGFDIMESEGFPLPFLSIAGNGYTSTLLNLGTLPVLLVLDPTSNIIYRGDLESAGPIIEDIMSK